MGDNSDGQMTVRMAKVLSNYYDKNCYKVLHDHGPDEETKGNIVSWFGDKYVKEAELSQIDIAFIEKSTDKTLALIEVEESSDQPKTLLGDVFANLLGEHYKFQGNRNLNVGNWTTLIIMGKSDTDHNNRNEFLELNVHYLRAAALIGKVVIKSFTGEENLQDQLMEQIDLSIDRAEEYVTV